MSQDIKKRRKIFKCPICGETIHFIVKQPENVEKYPFLVEYSHNDHILKIYFDKDLMIREIR